MTEDEMKNRISMALKEPILQQGFEIICAEVMINFLVTPFIKWLREEK